MEAAAQEPAQVSAINFLLTLCLRTLGDEATISLITCETKFAGGAFERGTLVESFGCERGDARGDTCDRRRLRRRVVINNCAVNDEHHLAARRLFFMEARGQFAQAPARELFVQLGQLARN